MLKIIAWIVVIWFVVSIVIGVKNEGSESITPIVHEYFYQLKEKPLITIGLTILVVLILFGILF